MPETEARDGVDTAEFTSFFNEYWVLLFLTAAILVGIYLAAPRFVRLIVRRAFAAGARDIEDSGVTRVELEKRVRTIESLTLTLLRSAIVLIIAFIAIGIFDLWGVMTGIGLLLAALTLAGQSIVLDDLMGVLIVIEGTYFKGDDISAGDPSWRIAGTIEEVGLRRTVIRGPDGTVHSISNGLMRQVSNRTRIYAAGEVVVRGIREEDLGRVIELMDLVGLEVATDPELRDSIIEAPQVRFLGDPDELGWSATMRDKVYAAERWAVGSAIRRRLNRAMLDAHIELNHRGVAPRLARSGVGLAVSPDASERGE